MDHEINNTLPTSKEIATNKLLESIHPSGNGEIAPEILAEADINHVGIGKYTALHWAVTGNQVEAVKALLGAGANVHLKSDCGDTPLHKAAFGSHIEIIKLLLAAGADINAQNNYGDTPISWGVDFPEVIDTLIEYNADVNLTDSDGKTPLMTAAHHEGAVFSMLALIHGGADINAISSSINWTALHYAINKNISDHVVILLKFGADITKRTSEDKTAFDISETTINRVEAGKIQVALKAAEYADNFLTQLRNHTRVEFIRDVRFEKENVELIADRIANLWNIDDFNTTNNTEAIENFKATLSMLGILTDSDTEESLGSKLLESYEKRAHIVHTHHATDNIGVIDFGEVARVVLGEEAGISTLDSTEY